MLLFFYVFHDHKGTRLWINTSYTLIMVRRWIKTFKKIFTFQWCDILGIKATPCASHKSIYQPTHSRLEFAPSVDSSSGTTSAGDAGNLSIVFSSLSSVHTIESRSSLLDRQENHQSRSRTLFSVDNSHSCCKRDIRILLVVSLTCKSSVSW